MSNAGEKVSILPYDTTDDVLKVEAILQDRVSNGIVGLRLCQTIHHNHYHHSQVVAELQQQIKEHQEQSVRYQEFIRQREEVIAELKVENDSLRPA